jgi:23S rRNA pseudouridine1911/1915/1917 synthase
MKRRLVVCDVEGELAPVLATQLEVSRAVAARLIGRGAVYVNGRRCREAGHRVTPGDKLLAVLEEGGASVLSRGKPSAPLTILFEDDDLIVIDKAPGMVSQPTPGRAGGSAVDLVSAHLGTAAGLVHRIDKETSGVLVFGKNRYSTAELAKAFREGLVRKTYLAVVGPGLPVSGVIDLPLSRDPSRPGRWRASRRANGLPAVTHFATIVAGEPTVLALFPKTGRTHQLRAHLRGLEHAIVGDKLYEGAEGPRCLLHAWRLQIGRHTFVAPVPSDFPPVSAAQLAGILTPRT